MAQTRNVPDNPVMVPAFVREDDQPDGAAASLSRLAKPVADAIRLHRVKAFAPEQLHAEFLRIIREKALGRDSQQRLSSEQARDALRSFRELPITYLPSKQVAEEAERLTFECGISADDSWYVAAALAARAEFWMSHDHSDGLAEAARREGVAVRVLSRDRFT